LTLRLQFIIVKMCKTGEVLLAFFIPSPTTLLWLDRCRAIFSALPV
jgi:hypothetical protein